MKPLPIFVGWDEREEIGFHAFVRSLVKHSSQPLAITPLFGAQPAGCSTSFTMSRFLVPFLCDFKGRALWMDGSDMLCRQDIASIFEVDDAYSAAYVVKHDYTPSYDRKFIGTEMETDNKSYPRKNWSSVILFENSNFLNKKLTPHFIEHEAPESLHRFGWLPDNRVGELPIEWNWLDEFGTNYEAKIVHYTNGIPGFAHYATAPHAAEWKEHARAVNRGLA